MSTRKKSPTAWWNPEHARPSVRRSRAAKHLTARMLSPDGYTNHHSALGMFLPVEIEACVAAGRPFALHSLCSEERTMGYQFTTNPQQQIMLSREALVGWTLDANDGADDEDHRASRAVRDDGRAAIVASLYRPGLWIVKALHPEPHALECEGITVRLPSIAAAVRFADAHIPRREESERPLEFIDPPTGHEN